MNAPILPTPLVAAFLSRIGALALLLAVGAHAQTVPPRVDSLAQAFVDAGHAPSLVVGVTRGGVRSVAGYGRVGGAAPTAATRYEIGSVTKTVTALALAQAVLRGDVALETPVQTLLPDSVRLAVVGRPVTLADLATHRSGLPRLPVPFAPAVFLDPYADYTEADLMRTLASVRPDSAGVRFAYSNLGVGLLGWVLARQSRLSVEALLTRDVLAPLGMTATSTSGDVAPPQTGTGTPLAPWRWTDALAAAGALRSSASDLLTLAEAVARPERAPALADALRLVVTPRAASRRGRIGLAWQVQDGPPALVYHNGATFGSVAFVGVRPGEDVGLVLLANAGANEALDALAGQILRALAAP